MLNKILNSIKKHTLLTSLKAKLRIVFRIKNRNVYFEYLSCKMYKKLYRKYNKVIQEGVDETLKRKKSDYIWICWLQGLDNAPDLVKACFNSIKQACPNKKIVLIDNNNLKDYISLPNYIFEKWQKGIIPNAHFTDVVRTALLCKYGGCWIDSTVLCTAKFFPKYIEDTNLFVFKQMNLYGMKGDFVPMVASNWFMYSETNNPIMLLTLKILYEYWRRENKLQHYFIYHLFFGMACRRYPEEWEKVPTYNNHSPHTMQFELLNKYSDKRWEQLKQISDFHKLNHRIKCEDGSKTIYNYIIDNYGDKNEK